MHLFGATIGNMLVAQTISAAMEAADDRERLKSTILSIVNNQKVISMWHKAKATNQAKEWMSLLP